MAKDKFDRSKIPASGPNPVVKVPAFWKKDLTGGMKMIGTENTELPTVTMSIKIPGGHLLQTNNLEKAGLASFFADMMNEDTKNYSAEQMSRELQKLGSSVNVSSGLDGITFSVQCLKKNIDATLKFDRLLSVFHFEKIQEVRFVRIVFRFEHAGRQSSADKHKSRLCDRRGKIRFGRVEDSIVVRKTRIQ